MIAHTPGPWTFRSDLDQIEAGLTTVANVFTHCWLGVEPDDELPSDRAKYAEHMANARLIAAAPELLAECERELAWLRHIRPQIQAPSSVMLGFDQAEKALASAIAKAKGAAS